MRPVLAAPFAAACLMSVCAWSVADVVLPVVLSDGMVIQQKALAPLWGWARAGEKVRVTPSWPGAEAVEVTADEKGRWLARVRTPDGAKSPGPFDIAIAGDSTITLHDVLVGEVWVCSGQSNMEWNLGGIGPGREGVPGAEAEVVGANYPMIRLYTAPNTIAAQERADIERGGAAWRACTPGAAREFSAVGYFFGRGLHAQLKTPVGLISADWGGTPAESWTSAAALGAFPEFAADLAMLADASDPNKRSVLGRDRADLWWDGIDTLAGGPGAGWAAAGFDDAAWKSMELPATLGKEGEGLQNYDGFVYFRKKITIPAAFHGKPCTLYLGPIDDRDDAFLNGERIGGTRQDGYWGRARAYQIPGEKVKSGEAVIGVRMLDTAGPGGINGKPEQMAFECDDKSVSIKALELDGGWKYFAGPEKKGLPPMPESGAVRIGPHTASALFNGMIAPLTNLAVRGCVWYQGESNVGRAAQYARLFPAMIGDWRARFNAGGGGVGEGAGALAFYFVQIAPFDYGNDLVNAAELREAQTAALALPGTGMVCTLDLGNPSDIHPDNKQEVGRRLANLALRKTYKIAGPESEGPVFDAMEVVGDEVHVRFKRTEGGLVPTADPIGGFVIAGADKRFFPAFAGIDGDTVVLSNEAVSNPVAARYGFTASPAAAVRSKAGLPLEPFRTDRWAGGEVVYEDGGRTEFMTTDLAFRSLFNWKDLTGWVNVNTAPGTWTVRDNMIVCSGHPTGVLRTDKQYQNFVVEFEWRHMSPGGNAGFFVWSDALTARGVPFTRSVEIQVMDGQEGDGYTSDGDVFAIHGATMTVVNGRGGTSRSFPTEKRARPSPRWNHYRVECVDGNISLAVNGKVVTTAKDVKPRKGYICLESEGSEVHFRNIIIKELPASAAALPAEEVAKEDEEFRSLYTGADLSGWKHEAVHEGHWTANDWTIGFDGEGEDLWSTASYKDFVLMCDWRWTAEPWDADLAVILPNGEQDKNADGTPKTARVKEAGDSGIYLRGNSKSQVNIWCWPVGSGEVYGYRTDAAMSPEVRAGATPKVNADAPIGQWNRFIITMKGDRLSVVLNGKTVLENAQLPGVPESGPIALQKHGGKIEFANIYIKELK